jgi:hypothetical protein
MATGSISGRLGFAPEGDIGGGLKSPLPIAIPGDD